MTDWENAQFRLAVFSVLYTFFSCVLLAYALRVFTKIRLTCMLTGLATLALAIANMIRIPNTPFYYPITPRAYETASYTGTVVYCDLLVALMYTLARKLRPQTNSYSYINKTTLTVSITLTVLSNISVAFTAYYFNVGTDDAWIIAVDISYGIFMCSTFAAFVHAFLPLLWMRQAFGDTECVAVGIWYLIAASTIFVLYGVDFIASIFYKPTTSPGADVLLWCFGCILRMSLITFYSFPPLQCALNYMRKSLSLSSPSTANSAFSHNTRADTFALDEQIKLEKGEGGLKPEPVPLVSDGASDVGLVRLDNVRISGGRRMSWR